MSSSVSLKGSKAPKGSKGKKGPSKNDPLSPENLVGFNAKGRKCEAPWFSDPANCIVGRHYLIRRFINGYTQKYKYIGPRGGVNVHDQSVRKSASISYFFEEVPTRITYGVREGMSLMSDNNDSCLKEVEEGDGAGGAASASKGGRKRIAKKSRTHTRRPSHKGRKMQKTRRALKIRK